MLARHRWLRACGFILLSLMAAQAAATNGYFNHGYGTKCKGMAGATTAMSLCSLSASNNPASMLNIGNRFDAGVAFFMPDRGFTANQIEGVPAEQNPIPAGTYDSDSNLFYVPHLGWNKMLSKDSAVGISIGANGGMNTDYDAAVFENFARNPQTGQLPPEASGFRATAPTGVDLQQLFVGFTWSQRIARQHAVGVTPILIYQRFEAKGLQPFKAVSAHPDQVTNNGHANSFGGGVRVGWLSEISKQFSFGVSYQTRIYSQPFEKYKGLFADGGDFDLPPIFNTGIAFKPTPNLALTFDYQRIFYSNVDALSNPHDLNLRDPQTPRLGSADGLGFGWKDMNVYKLGAQWLVNERWSLRLGYNYASQPIPNDQALLNILAPAVLTEHFTAGFTYGFTAKDELNFAVMHAPREKVYGTNPNTRTQTGTQTGNIEMSQTEFEVSWGRRF